MGFNGKHLLEYGSDFDACPYPVASSAWHVPGGHRLYLCGRMAILHLVMYRGYKRLWMPSYFCHGICRYLEANGVRLAFYPATPESAAIPAIPFEEGDALLRMNFFGRFGFMERPPVPVDVVEDHSHDLDGAWARSSDADWCVASLRKTIPIPDGGILWSPRAHRLPPMLAPSPIGTEFTARRREAMCLKTRYLRGETVDKTHFRNIYLQTEEELDALPIATVASSTFKVLSEIDVDKWYALRQANWDVLSQGDYGSAKVLKPRYGGRLSHLVLRFPGKSARDKSKAALIGEKIYPAVLWDVPGDCDADAKRWGDTMLALHCDGRYAPAQMAELRSRLEMIFNNLKL